MNLFKNSSVKTLYWKKCTGYWTLELFLCRLVTSKFSDQISFLICKLSQFFLSGPPEPLIRNFLYRKITPSCLTLILRILSIFCLLKLSSSMRRFKLNFTLFRRENGSFNQSRILCDDCSLLKQNSNFLKTYKSCVQSGGCLMIFKVSSISINHVFVWWLLERNPSSLPGILPALKTS